VPASHKSPTVTRLTLRTYRDVRAWVNQNYYDLPNMDSRANLIGELGNRWTDAASTE
jgi:hypothetical protein